MINELDQVVLVKPLPGKGLEAGDVGTVVMAHERGAGFTVEFMNAAGKTVAIVAVDAVTVRTIRRREVVHAREVAQT